jgi:hypothetical protein
MTMIELKIGDLVQTPRWRERGLVKEDFARIITLKKFTMQIIYMSGKKFGKTEVWSINEAKRINKMELL